MIKRPGKEKGYTLIELILVVSIVAVLVGIIVPQLMVQKQRIIEVQAQRRLRRIGTMMVEYSLSQPSGNYADFRGLKDAHLISGDLTQTTLIRDYSLAFGTFRAERMGRPARYTIIAYPIPERSNGSLETFAITEDNVVRTYKPGPDRDPINPYTWDPIL